MKISGFLSEIFQFLEVEFSTYLNRRVFVMQGTLSTPTKPTSFRTHTIFRLDIDL